MRFQDLFEATAPTVGRKYQHIEDLVFTNGSSGGLHAVERLSHMGQEGGTIELKWDGNPVVYWGRDEKGQFSLVTKNAWEYAKRGKTDLDGIPIKASSPDDIIAFITGTGKAQAGHEQVREKYAGDIANLWSLFEAASPKQGYLEGGILFRPGQEPQLNSKTGEYDFTPNITTFHVPANSTLGKRIAGARVMVAATGFYDSFGSSNEGRLTGLEKLSTPDLIVQGTTYVQEPAQIDQQGLQKTEAYITQNARLIDGFLAPKQGLSKPGDVLYKFYNQNLRMAGVKAKFEQWAETNLSAGQAGKVLGDPGLDAVLTAVEMITDVKEKMIAQLSQATHGGIRQTKPEGYAQAHPTANFKNPLPGQFVKTVSQQTWAPKKA
jgi:hypothetical protein